MTLEEASERFCIDIENLSYYEKNGLLIYKKLVNNVPDYTEEELHKVGMIHALLDAGMDLDILQNYLKLNWKKAGNREEQIRILRKQRYRLLEEIHGKQQTLDEIDYIISEMKKGG